MKYFPLSSHLIITLLRSIYQCSFYPSGLTFNTKIQGIQESQNTVSRDKKKSIRYGREVEIIILRILSNYD